MPTIDKQNPLKIIKAKNRIQLPVDFRDQVTGGAKPAEQATKNNIFAQNTAPTGGYQEEALWFDTSDNNKIYRANADLAWISVQDGTIFSGVWNDITGAGKPADDADVTAANQAATAASLANHDADDLAESGTKKWAGETGADVTSANETFSQNSDIDALQTTNAPADAAATAGANLATNVLNNVIGNISDINEEALQINQVTAGFNYTIPMDSGSWTVQDSAFTAGGIYAQIESNGPTWWARTNLIGTGSDTNLQFDNTGITVSVSFWFRIVNGTTGDRHLGFSAASVLGNVYDANNNHVTFAINGSTIYAHTGQDAVDSTEVNISSGITVGNWNLGRIDYELGVQASFYLNGVFKTTITDTIPNDADSVYFGVGGTDNGEDIIFMAPIVQHK